MAFSKKSPCKSEAEQREECICLTNRQSLQPLTQAKKIDTATVWGKWGLGNVTNDFKELFGYLTSCSSIQEHSFIKKNKKTKNTASNDRNAQSHRQLPLLEGEIMLPCHGKRGTLSLIDI